MTVALESGSRAARSVAVSALALLGARIIQFVLSLVVTVALVRYLGPSAYGDYVFVLALIGILVVLGDFGLTKVAVREIARGASEAAVVGTTLVLRLVLGAALAGVAQLVLAAMGARDELRVAAAIASTWLLTEPLLAIAIVYQVRIAMHYEALMTLVAYGVQTAGVLWLIASGGTVHQIVALPALGGLAAAVLGATIARVRYGAGLRLDLQLAPRLVLAGLPIGITVALAFINLKLDSVLLGMLASARDVGLYGAAAKPIEYLTVAATVIMNPVYPLLARWHHEDRTRFAWLYGRMATLLAAIALPVPVALLFLAHPLIAAIFSEEFAGSAAALQLLGVALALTLITAWHGFTLLAAGRQNLTLAYDTVALVACVGLNLLLVPRLGYLGTAWAAVGTSVLALACSTLATARVGARLERAPLARVALAGAGFGALLWGLGALGAGALASLLIAGAGYGVALVGSGVFPWREVRALLPMGGAVGRQIPEPEVL